MKDLRLEPKRAWVTTGGQVAVTVRGRGIGFVTCAAERRFVWGRFVTCFLVDARQNTSVTVSARGPFAGQSWTLKLAPKADVTPKRVPGTGALCAPRVRPVKFRVLPSPRLKASLLDQPT
jgi:hypothetical protein